MTNKFKFVNIKYREAGTAKDKTTGKTFNYKAKYLLKLAEASEDGEVFEMECKISEEKKELIEKLEKCKPFQDVTVELYIKQTSYGIDIIIKDVILENESQD